MGDFGTLALAALALNALGGKPAASAPPPPPKQPDPAPGGGGELAAQLGSVAGTALTALLGAVGGGGGGGGTASIAAGGAATGTLTAGGGGAGAAGGSSLVGGAFAVGGITAGGVFAFAWAAFFVAQFVVINLVNSARIGWLRYRSSVSELNSNPYWHVHSLELELVRQTCAFLRIPPPAEQYADDSAIQGSLWASIHPGEPGDDPRLKKFSITAEDGQQSLNAFFKHRTIMGNPFTGTSAFANWRFVQMAARLVAVRYAYDLGRFARGMLGSMPNLGGHAPSGWGASELDVWNYPLVGGGQPDKTYAAFHQEMLGLETSLNPRPSYSVDDLLRGAHLAALVRAAGMVSSDTGIYSPWNPALYAQWLYNALGLAGGPDSATLSGHVIALDPGYYKVPAQQMWLDVDNLKAGKPSRPFLITDPALVPTPPHETSLAVKL